MMRSLLQRRIFEIALLMACIAFFSCSSNQIAAGDVTDTGNATAKGVILTSHGDSAPGVEVLLLPANYNPVRDSIVPDSCKDTTDSQGRFSFSIIPAQQCNLQAFSRASGERLLISNLTIGGALHPVSMTVALSKPGSVMLAIPEGAQAGGKIMVVGTDLVATLLTDDIMRGFSVIDSLPSGNLPSLAYAAPQQLNLTSYINTTVAVVSADTSVQPSLLLFPWLQTGIGLRALAGGGISTHEEFRIAGSGSDIFWAADAFHFVYQRFAGNFELRAHLTSFEAPASASQNVPKAGVMIRESLEPDSRHATVSWDSRNNGTILHWRTNTGDSSSFHGLSKNGSHLPVWLTISRIGAVIYGQCSYDGTTWTSRDSLSMALPDTVYLGLSVTSGDAQRLNTAVFDSVSVH